MSKLVCFHLLNDLSGSPKVLRTVLELLLQKGYEIDLVSSKGEVLDSLSKYKGFRKFSYPYKFSKHKVIEALRYSLVQLYTFFLSFRWLFRKDIIFYINTLLPIGPALAGKIMGKKLIYHYHENAQAKGGIYIPLANMMERLSDRIICVSNYQAKFLKRQEKITLIPNSLPYEFTQKLHPNPQAAFGRKTILMLASLKGYKGINEFIGLSNQLPEYKFVLVINDSKENVDKFAAHIENTNLQMLSRREDVSALYNEASLVMNLSDKHFVVETFGLTALEAMSAGLPVIVPTEGGISELVEDGFNGYKIDVENLDEIKDRIEAVFCNKDEYLNLSGNAYRYSQNFSSEKMIDSIISVIEI